MDAVHATLRRLRGWFVAWFVLQSAIGTVIAAYVVEGMQQHALLRYLVRGVDPVFTVAAGILGSLFVFLVALLVLSSLLELRTWARLVLLIVGWISVFSAAMNLLTAPGTIELLRPAVGAAGGGLAALGAAYVFTKLLDLVFWSWAIYTLQFNRVVWDAFIHPGPEGPGLRAEDPGSRHVAPGR